MKKIITMIILAMLTAGVCQGADDKSIEPNRQFYKGNSSYEKRDYAGALEEYLKVLNSGINSGNLYYNIGNTYFKMGKVGYAILYYEKAKRLIPQDSDLRSNLDYAKSLVGSEISSSDYVNFLIKMIRLPFNDFNLNAIAITALIIYILLILVMAAFILKPFWARKFRLVLVLVLMLFALSFIAFFARYYDEEILAHGIVVVKAAESKYEPIDKSTTFYRLHEGDEVYIIKTRNGWRQVKRPDGKIGWVDKEAVQEI